MSGYVHLMLTILCNEQLLKIALKANSDKFKGDVLEYPLEPENRAIIRSLLPDYVVEYGPVVDVERIFDIIEI